jgi:hypothetical protein
MAELVDGVDHQRTGTGLVSHVAAPAGSLLISWLLLNRNSLLLSNGFSLRYLFRLVRADYPYTTVPNKVDQLFRAQDFHARKQREARSWMTREERAKAPFVDYYRPIIADGDTGHGGLTAVMRLTKLFIEAGAAVRIARSAPGERDMRHFRGC